MQKNRKTNINRVIVIALMVLGAICITISAFYVSSYLAIVGVSFIFWGSILLYIAPAKHVPVTFLTASTATNMSNIERLLNEYGLNEKGIYLPPKNLKDPESSLLFIPKTQNPGLPEPEETTVPGLFNAEMNGIFLTPSGYTLAQLFEQKLGRSFTQLDLSAAQKTLPNLLVEELSIAENVEIQTENHSIIIELTGNALGEDLRETGKNPLGHNVVGCLLSSALACVLAKTTGKPIVIEKEEQSKKTTKFVFKLLEE